MFKSISRRIALQFTAFVFLLVLFNGLVFLIADVENAQRMARSRLMRSADLVAHQAQIVLEGGSAALPKALREQIRIVGGSGQLIHVGEVFANVPFIADEGFWEMRVDNDDRYNVVTIPLQKNGAIEGYVQLADVQRIGAGDLPLRSLLYVLVSIAISVLTYAVGRAFAWRSLKPAEQAMRQLEQFTQDASHELRTPLTALSSSLDLALKTKQYREGIESAKEDLHQVSALLERLLQIARLGELAVERAPVDVSAVVAQAVERFRPLAMEHRVMLKDAVMPGVTLQADESLIRQVLTNLLGNAVKFSKPEGGTVTVTLTHDALSVADEGIGIAAKELPHIFNRFYQADASRSEQGFGLGLALAKRIVELHGWSIGVKSTQGKGAAFTIRFSARS